MKRVHDRTAINRFVRSLDNIPVIDTHKVGIMYVAPGQTQEEDILRNVHGSPAYTQFLEGIGRLINLRGQVDVYAGGLDPDEDGEYAYAWWDDIGQILYHTATMMPTKPDDPACNNKKRHIGNDYVRIVWNDSALPYRFDTLKTQFQFVNIVIEPHSVGAIAAFANKSHEMEYFKVTIQSAPGMTEFAPIGFFKLNFSGEPAAACAPAQSPRRLVRLCVLAYPARHRARRDENELARSPGGHPPLQKPGSARGRSGRHRRRCDGPRSSAGLYHIVLTTICL